ncbi:MAG: exosortase family protein XrtM [Gammaproteobacteria bacterium]
MGFIGIFVLDYLVLYGLYFTLPDEILTHYIYYYGIVHTARQIVQEIAPLDAVSAFDNVLYSPRATLEIVRGCDGSGVMFLLVAAIAAYPSAWRGKIIGILSAIVLTCVLNQARIVGLYFTLTRQPDWFIALHTYLVPTLFVILAVGFFATWASH